MAMGTLGGFGLAAELSLLRDQRQPHVVAEQASTDSSSVLSSIRDHPIRALSMVGVPTVGSVCARARSLRAARR